MAYVEAWDLRCTFPNIKEGQMLLLRQSTAAGAWIWGPSNLILLLYSIRTQLRLPQHEWPHQLDYFGGWILSLSIHTNIFGLPKKRFISLFWVQYKTYNNNVEMYHRVNIRCRSMNNNKSQYLGSYYVVWTYIAWWQNYLCLDLCVFV